MSKKRSTKRSRETWVPNRQDVIWIDCTPQVGREMRDVHPFLVLSSRAFNERTSLVIGLPMTIAAYNADNPFAVAIGPAVGRKTGISYVLCHQPKSFDWRLRRARPHPRGRVPDPAFAEARARLSQIVQLDD